MAHAAYFLKNALQHIGRSPVVAAVTVGTVAVVFLVLIAFGLIGHNLSLLADRLAEGFTLSIYLADDCAEAKQQVVTELLRDDESVQQVRFVSRQEALERFRARLGASATVLEGIGQNPLPASFEVTFTQSARSPQRIRALAQRVVTLDGVEEVQYGEGWIERYFSFMRTVRLLGLGIGALVLLAALLIVSNTIRLSLYARRDEITILQLVGATDRFIKVPFFLEGLLLGMAGAGLGLGLGFGGFALLAPSVNLALGLSGQTFFVEFFPPALGGWIIGGGALLGLAGTLTSLWRNLRL